VHAEFMHSVSKAAAFQPVGACLAAPQYPQHSMRSQPHEINPHTGQPQWLSRATYSLPHRQDRL